MISIPIRARCITPTPSPVPDFALGGQVNNSDEHLDVLEEARMSWVKVQLRFGIGADASSTVQGCGEIQRKGIQGAAQRCGQ